MRNRKQRGMALITAIWILAVLVVLVGGFAAMVHSETQIARNFGQLAQARWAARAGIHRAEAEVLHIAESPVTTLEGSRLELTAEDENVELGPASYTAVITDEAGKVNLNTASAEVLATLLTEEVADAVIDWRDEDSTPQPLGAEDDYYSGLATPYRCKNAPFTTVREVLLVKGMTLEDLTAPVTEDGQTLEALLTVSSWDSNTDADGQARINITTATKETLTSAFSDVLAAEEIDAIIAQRTATAFSSPADLLRVSNLPRQKVAQIYDRLTAVTQQRRTGLVNVNTAPLEVLVALGLDETIARAIVQQRDAQGPFADVGQVLTMQQVTPSAFMQVADQLTTRSKVFRVAATGSLQDGVSQTITCVLEAETANGATQVRTLYWRE